MSSLSILLASCPSLSPSLLKLASILENIRKDAQVEQENEGKIINKANKEPINNEISATCTSIASEFSGWGHDRNAFAIETNENVVLGNREENSKIRNDNGTFTAASGKKTFNSTLVATNVSVISTSKKSTSSKETAIPDDSLHLSSHDFILFLLPPSLRTAAELLILKKSVCHVPLFGIHGVGEEVGNRVLQKAGIVVVRDGEQLFERGQV